jgi:hypothetical protein
MESFMTIQTIQVAAEALRKVLVARARCRGLLCKIDNAADATSRERLTQELMKREEERQAAVDTYVKICQAIGFPLN